jgi:hypothetical protein
MDGERSRSTSYFITFGFYYRIEWPIAVYPLEWTLHCPLSQHHTTIFS